MWNPEPHASPNGALQPEKQSPPAQLLLWLQLSSERVCPFFPFCRGPPHSPLPWLSPRRPSTVTEAQGEGRGGKEHRPQLRGCVTLDVCLSLSGPWVFSAIQ